MAKEYVESRNAGFYVADTRVSLDSIVYAFLDGQSPESILEDFETLSLEQVYGAIAYYLANQAAVDAYLSAQQRRVEVMRRSAKPLDPSLRARLLKAREQLRVGSE